MHQARVIGSPGFTLRSLTSVRDSVLLRKEDRFIKLHRRSRSPDNTRCIGYSRRLIPLIIATAGLDGQMIVLSTSARQRCRSAARHRTLSTIKAQCSNSDESRLATLIHYILSHRRTSELNSAHCPKLSYP
ncbi:hypothetical protein AB1N83_006785 [Pleurotus pulmonarius]